MIVVQHYNIIFVYYKLIIINKMYSLKKVYGNRLLFYYNISKYKTSENYYFMRLQFKPFYRHAFSTNRTLDINHPFKIL